MAGKTKNPITVTHPELVGQWWSEDNTITPDIISAKSSKTAEWICTDRGHTFMYSIRSFTKSPSCRVCDGTILLSGYNDIETKAPHRARYWDYTVDQLPPSQIRAKSSDGCRFICEKGHKFTMIARHVMKGHWCKFCAGVATSVGENDLTVTSPDLLKIWHPTKNNDISPDQFMRGSHAKVWWQCPKGHSWINTIHNVGNGSGCPTCSGRTLSAGSSLGDLFPNLVAEWSPRNPKTPYEYHRQSNDEAEWVCSRNSQHIWTSKIYSRTSNVPTDCPTCFSSGSKAEKEFIEYVRSLVPDEKVYINYEGLCRGKRHVDLCIPRLGLAFEFNGLYWHSDAPGLRNSPVSEKVQDCAGKGIDLYVVWEDDWRDRRTISERWVQHLLGVSNSAKINARSCEIRPVSKGEARVFLKDNHVQGNKDGSIRIGLYSDDVLVAIAVFVRAGSTLRLERYATSCSVRGGFTRLISWVDRNVDYRVMETFADLTYSRGKLYDISGWSINKVLDPDYQYAVRGSRQHKFNYRVKRFKDRPDLKYVDGKTERELAHMNGIYRVYDAGKVKYVRNNPNL